MSPMNHHVANAVAKTSAIEMAVFCTTESTVIRPWSTWPGVPVPQVAGSLEVSP